MKYALAIAFALSLVGCSRYETRTADGMTIRTDKSTGNADVLVDGEWRRIPDSKGKPCNPADEHARLWRKLGYCT